MEKLKEYKSKRNFESTAEPKGTKTTKHKKLQFVVQHHMARHEHYDFRLEWGGVLISWAVPKGPSLNPKHKRLAVHVEDHPIEYARFEGVIPKGEYGGGTVLLWDKGTWEPLNENFEKAFKKGVLKFVLKGKRLKGKWTLIKLTPKKGEKADNWLLIKENDEHVQKNFEINKQTTSIKSGRTTKQIESTEDVLPKKNPFKKANVQLATLVSKLPTGNNWIYEIKYDGYRILTFCEQGKVRLLSRNNNNYTAKFAAVASDIKKWSKQLSFVLDGEMVVTDENGKSNFQDLQSYLKNPRNKVLSYMVFDILALNGKDLRNVKLIERKEILKKLLKNAPPSIVFSEHIVGHGNQFFKEVQKMGLEGIIGKLAHSTYSGTRNGDWIKLKCYKRQEFVVGGYTRSSKKADGISSLLLGVYENNEFVYVGKAGTGINNAEQNELIKKFSALKSKQSFFSVPPKKKSNEQLFWLQPKVVVEVQYAEITNEKVLRQAAFKGVRTDKSALDVVLEGEHVMKNEANNETVVEGITISNPNKIVYKADNIKKIDVINYYASVAPRMLPFTKNRILSVVRCHSGVGEQCFFKKHPSTKSEGVGVVPVVNSRGETDEYFYVKNNAGLIAQAQLGTIEFHVWGSCINNIDKPDIMVFDLDPDENLRLQQIRQGVMHLKKVLDNLGLKSFLKTSGGKGYHVVVPVKRTVSWETFNNFSKMVAMHMAQKWPENYTSNIRKSNRHGKIFIDWVRNGKGATSVAPYSLRARPGAKVSMPIFWSELNKIAPNGIDITEAIKRCKQRDPWRGFFEIKQEIKKINNKQSNKL